jgi:hypothetical protein
MAVWLQENHPPSIFAGVTWRRVGWEAPFGVLSQSTTKSHCILDLGTPAELPGLQPARGWHPLACVA